jgi:hypothetical protein
MSQALRWTLVAVAAFAAIALIAFARGEDHHRGPRVGAYGGASVAAVPVTHV